MSEEDLVLRKSGNKKELLKRLEAGQWGNVYPDIVASRYLECFDSECIEHVCGCIVDLMIDLNFSSFALATQFVDNFDICFPLEDDTTKECREEAWKGAFLVAFKTYKNERSVAELKHFFDHLVQISKARYTHARLGSCINDHDSAYEAMFTIFDQINLSSEQPDELFSLKELQFDYAVAAGRDITEDNIRFSSVPENLYLEWLKKIAAKYKITASDSCARYLKQNHPVARVFPFLPTSP